MKITYPDFQIEISVDEVIELLDYNEAAKPQVKFEPRCLRVPELPASMKQIYELEAAGKTIAEEAAKDYFAKQAKPKPAAKPKAKKEKDTNKANNKRAVEVKSPVTGEWKRYDSASAAAEALGGTASNIFRSLKNGIPYKGHDVRYAADGDTPDNDAAMDAIMAEIQENNRKPYEPSRPIR